MLSYSVLLAGVLSLAGLDPAWIALVGTLCGGIGLKVAEHWLSKGRLKSDDATQIRSELRSEVTVLRDEKQHLEAQVNKWREDYYVLKEEVILLRAKVQVCESKITDLENK